MAGTHGSARRHELRQFLTSRRARVRPAEVGLPDGGARRRTPGLRREEVAVLAGVSPSWYQWLEQGRDITVSSQVLDAVSRVLRLDETERRHLYTLAGLNPPLPDPSAGQAGCAQLQRLIDAWMPYPAHMLDPCWNHLAWNESARLVLGVGDADRNCLMEFFRSDTFRGRTRSWAQVAPAVVATFRAAVAQHPANEDVREVVAEISAASPEFAELWARHDVRAAGVLTTEVRHPEVGALDFETTQLRVPSRPDLTIVLHHPRPGTDTAAKLARLTSSDGQGDAMWRAAG
ncbi:helix-turn-helix transcriptional regulator [Streptosporangium sp. CA-135522]|uniref:helix-turn-helix transcriptional regulator n=1 Tax=Streptosporangium sp. CA-135522 TaxID=3240072 RepID=UPI003D94C70B